MSDEAERDRPAEGGPAAPAPDTVSISANLPQATVEQLQWIASKRGTSMTEVLQRAVEHEAFFLDQASKGAKVLTQDSQGRMKRVIIE